MKEKVIEFPKYSDCAVVSFLKFLYGFNLDEENDIDYAAVLQLIEMGRVYDIREVQDAAAKAIERYLTKENVFEVMQVCKDNDAKEAFEFCYKFHFNPRFMDMVYSSPHHISNTNK